VTVADRPQRSIAFDRAAADYDRTRALSPVALARVMDLLSVELAGRGRCLEIGVGTGRMALPLSERGISLIGIDLSMPMLRRLTENAGGSAPFPVAQADATALPFADAEFGAAVAVHVLHLIPGWEGVLREILRVVVGGGVFLLDTGGWGKGWWDRVVNRFSREAGIEQHFVGVEEPEQVDEFMRGLGARVRILPPIRESRSISIDRALELMERGTFSFTWRTPEEARRRAAAAVRPWAERQFGSLTRARRSVRSIAWRAYDLP
jgi:ubiquinone/menaquinone biosynthesis C-methylase UbiE